MTRSRNRTALLSLIIIGLIFISLYYSGRGTFAIRSVQRTVADILAPIHRLTDSVISPISHGFNYVISFKDTRAENEQLAAEVIKLNREIKKLKPAGEENIRLRQLIGFQSGSGYESIPARVIGRSSSSWQAILIIDKGKKDGIDENMPVITDDGVAGKIIKAGSSTSEMLMLIDERSGIGVENERTGQRGIVEGKVDGELRLKYIPKESDIKIGDRLMTSGIGLVYPRRLYVGEIIEVKEDQYSMEKKIKVKSGVNFNKLEEVLVVTDPTEKDLPEQSPSSK